MATKRRSNNAKRKTRQPKKQVRKRQKKGPKKPMSSVSAILSSVIDPCHGPVTPGVYGSSEGLTARVKTTYQTTGAGFDTCGMVLWIPSYHNAAGSSALSVTHFNLFIKVDNDPDDHFADTLALPMGAGTSPTAGNGFSIPDPASAFVDTGLVLDARTLAACLRLTYTGKVTETSGQICWIDNYGPAELMSNQTSVNEFFNRATKTSRLGLDTYEQLFRPDDATGTDRFRTGGAQDAAFTQAVPLAGPSYSSSTVRALQPKVIGFAWRGAQPGFLDHLVVESIKVVEWRPEVTAGLTGAIPRSLSVPSTTKMVAALDNRYPSWSSRISSAAMSAASSLKNGTWQAFQSEGGQALARIGTSAAVSYATGGSTQPLYLEVN